MTVYRLLHGSAWYEMDPPPRHVIPHGGFSSKLRWLPHIPPEWRRFIRKMLHDDADMRFASCSQVLSALAKLPTTDNWQAVVSPMGVSWSREIKGRRQRVRWRISKPRAHSWTATSEPISGDGSVRRLAGSAEEASQGKVVKELEAFFRSK